MQLINIQINLNLWIYKKRKETTPKWCKDVKPDLPLQQRALNLKLSFNSTGVLARSGTDKYQI